MLEELWLVHPEEEMCAAFQNRFASLPHVRVVQKRFQELEPHDCFVTAGNCYGIMTAGIDAAVIQRFGQEFMQRVQLHIMNQFLGEQPIGTAFLLSTGDSSLPFIAHAPTMRVPSSIDQTDHIYLATWGALVAIHLHNLSANIPIHTVAFPAMGTGFASVSYSEAARQMAIAYQHFLEPPHRLDWDLVVRREQAICCDQGRQVVR